MTGRTMVKVLVQQVYIIQWLTLTNSKEPGGAKAPNCGTVEEGTF